MAEKETLIFFRNCTHFWPPTTTSSTARNTLHLRVTFTYGLPKYQINRLQHI